MSLQARTGIKSPARAFRSGFLRKIQALLATPGKRDARIEMADMQSAAATKLPPTKPSLIPDETARLFQVALHDVVRSSALSMAELRECVKACVCSLRASDVGPAQMIISMKACAKEGNRRYPMVLNEHELSNADFLMEQIIKWSIVEYYKDA
jgi:hypothetical protein